MHKNKNHIQPNQVVFTRSQFVGLVCGAVIAGVIGGIFGSVRTINSDHFTLLALDNEVADLKKSFVPREEIESNWRSIFGSLERIENKLDAAIANRQVTQTRSQPPSDPQPAPAPSPAASSSQAHPSPTVSGEGSVAIEVKPKVEVPPAESILDNVANLFD